MSDQDWGAVGFWVEQIWPAWCGGHQGKGCCHKDDDLTQGKACCYPKVILVEQKFVSRNEQCSSLTFDVSRCGDWGTVVVTNKEK